MKLIIKSLVKIVYIYFHLLGVMTCKLVDLVQSFSTIHKIHVWNKTRFCSGWMTFYSIHTKPEVLVAGTRQQVAKLDTSNGIVVSGTIVPFSSKLRVLRATLDEELTVDDDISGIVRARNYHLRALRHIHVHLSIQTPLTPLHVCWYAWDLTTAMLFCMESRSKTLAASYLFRICSLVSSY